MPDKEDRVAMACSENERKLFHKYKADLVYAEGAKYMKSIHTVLYLFHLYEKEHIPLERIKKVLNEQGIEFNDTTNEQLIQFLFTEYMKYKEAYESMNR